MDRIWRARPSKASTGLAHGPISPQKAAIRKERGRMSDETLSSYRQSIDNIDAALVFLLAERFKVTQAVGRYKATAGLPAACANWPAQPIWIRTFRKNSCASSSTR
jgi:hypothetical protein